MRIYYNGFIVVQGQLGGGKVGGRALGGCTCKLQRAGDKSNTKQLGQREIESGNKHTQSVSSVIGLLAL